jgi:hypothetical protein
MPGIHEGGCVILDIQGTMTECFVHRLEGFYSAVYLAINRVNCQRVHSGLHYTAATAYNKIVRPDPFEPVSPFNLLNDEGLSDAKKTTLIGQFLGRLSFDYRSLEGDKTRSDFDLPIELQQEALRAKRFGQAVANFDTYTYTLDQLLDLHNRSSSAAFVSDYHIHFELETILDSIKQSNHNKGNCGTIRYNASNDTFTIPWDMRCAALLGKCFFQAILLWLVAVSNLELAIVQSWSLHLQTDIHVFSDIAKEMGERCKMMSNVGCWNLLKLFEFHVLINRVETPINWHQEEANRTSPNTTSIKDEDIYRHSVDILTRRKRLAKNCYKTMEWKDFWDTRLEWAPVGANYTQYDEDKIYEDDKRDFKNKLFLLAAMPEYGFDHFYDRPPEMHAKTSIKYEWSKQRAIYGCDLTNFIMSQFALGDCENSLDSRFPIGFNAKPSYVSGLIKSILNNREALCLDFEDFNSQHSHQHMKIVLQAFFDVHRDKMSPEQALALHWVRDSISNSFVHDVFRNKTYRSKGTLFSGWRLTSFVTTVLNYCYIKSLGVNFEHDLSIHSGDDVMIGNNSIRIYKRILQKCKDFNIRLSYGKCHYGSIAEFLRIDHSSNESGQYLCRGIASSIMGKIEGDPAYDAKDVIDSYLTRGAAYIARGGHQRFTAQTVKVTVGKVCKNLTGNRLPIITLLISNRVVGGLSSLSDALITKQISKTNFRHYIDDEQKQQITPKHTLTGITTYFRWLQKRFFQIKLIGPKAKDRMVENLIAGYARINQRFSVHDLSAAENRQARVLRSLKGAHSAAIYKIDYGRAKNVGILLDILASYTQTTTLYNVIRNSDKPLEILQKIV